jgi:hypothetical protein
MDVIRWVSPAAHPTYLGVLGEDHDQDDAPERALANPVGSTNPARGTQKAKVMTKLLDRAIREVASLPEVDQDRIAHLILEELRAEAGWHERFLRSQDELSRLAEKAREEIARGDVLDEDPGSTGPG